MPRATNTAVDDALQEYGMVEGKGSVHCRSAHIAYTLPSPVQSVPGPAPRSPFHAPAQKAPPADPLEKLPALPVPQTPAETHASSSAEPVRTLPAGPVHRTPSGPRRHFSSQGALEVAPPHVERWVRRVRSGRALHYMLPASGMGSDPGSTSHMVAEGSDTMQPCTCCPPDSHELRFNHLCMPQPQQPVNAPAAGVTGVCSIQMPSVSYQMQDSPFAESDAQHTSFAQRQPTSLPQPQTQLPRSHASAPNLVRASDACFASPPPEPRQRHAAPPLVLRGSGSSKPPVPSRMDRKCKLPSDRSLSVPILAAGQGFMQALLAEADAELPGPPDSLHSSPGNQLLGSSGQPLSQLPCGQQSPVPQGPWHSPPPRANEFTTPVKPAVTAASQESAVSAVRGRFPPAQGVRFEGAHEAEHLAPEPAMKRARSSGNLAGPVSLWQAVQPDRSLISEVGSCSEGILLSC